MGRIKHDVESFEKCVLCMVDGNPGAISVIAILQNYQGTLGALMSLVTLDTMGIYGSDIWTCYKDICGQNGELLVEKICDMSIKDDLHKLKEEQLSENTG